MVLYLDILVPALIALIPGLVIHSFIIVINVTDWMRGRLVTPVDLIITSLGMSRMCAQCAVTLSLLFSTIFLNKFYANVTHRILYTIYSSCIYTNIWLTSLLSIVFYLKISNLRTRLFLYLRRVMETPWLILVSVLLSCLNGLLSFFTDFTEGIKRRTNNTTINNTFLNALYSYTIPSFLPMLFSSISSVLLFTLLYRHITKMSGNLSINLETYYSAMTFVSITFIYNAIYFTGHIGAALYFCLLGEPFLQFHIVLGFLPVLHSSYLIYRTAKLRSHVSKVLQNVIDFFFRSKDKETREDI